MHGCLPAIDEIFTRQDWDSEIHLSYRYICLSGKSIFKMSKITKFGCKSFNCKMMKIYPCEVRKFCIYLHYARENNQFLNRKWLFLPRIIQIYTKFANFTRLYSLHFPTFSIYCTNRFTHSKRLRRSFYLWCWISFFLPWSKCSLYCSLKLESPILKPEYL
jgi:hypothetical protein